MNLYKSEIAKVLEANPSQISLYWKGRVGLYALLKAMGVSKGDEVIIPAFTCVVVPNAIIYLGAKPVYVDVKSDTFNTTVQNIKEKVTDKTKCIVIQNTFGLSSDIEEIIEFAKERNILTIEDCTHGFGGTYNGKPNGVFADASFFSTQWNKPFSTGIGGFVYLKNESFTDKLKEINKELVKPSFKEKFILGTLIKSRKLLLTPRTYWALLKLYRFLSKKGIVVGSSSGEEISSITEPKNYFKAFSKTQEKEGVKGLRKLNSAIEKRKKNGILFNQFLKENGKTYVKEELYDNHSFLKYPILVKNREEFKSKAEKSSINIGDWFVSMIHPITKDFENWQLNVNEFPVANEVSEKILNLDTDTKNPEKVMAFLKVNLNEIL
ncbi:aminotransferase class I/II-fold pyridoxal phosphate-dependent enzyme [Flavobacteriales bacterium]|nr:aminotransferase class I/II-fold pyridoxal phosphate-dependent enzyme [Flavobacteriales bacterium]